MKDQNEIQIGDNNALIFSCGKNENGELGFRNINALSVPCGLVLPNKAERII